MQYFGLNIVEGVTDRWVEIEMSWVEIEMSWVEVGAQVSNSVIKNGNDFIKKLRVSRRNTSKS